MVLRIFRRQCPQAAGRIQMPVNGIYHRPLLLRIQHGKGHGYGPDLIAANLLIRSRSRKNILQVTLILHVELLAERLLDGFRQRSVIRPIQSQRRTQRIHDPQGVIPIGIDLHRFAVTRCGENAVDTDIHPGHLIVAATGVDQAIFIHTDAVVGTLPVAGNNTLHGGPCFPYKRCIVRTQIILPDTVDQQQRRIHRVIHGLALALREEVRNKTVFFISEESSQDAFCILIATRCQAAARQRDHGIPTPVTEKRIAGQNRFASCGISVRNKGVSADGQLAGNGVFKCAAGSQFLLMVTIFLQQILCAAAFRLHGEYNSLLYGAACRNPDADAAAAGTQTLGRTTILGILGIRQCLPDGAALADFAIRLHMQPISAVSNDAIGIGEFFYFIQSLFLGDKFQEGIHIKRAVLTGEIFNLIHDCRRIFSAADAKRALHGNSLGSVDPSWDIFHRKIRQIAEAIFICTFLYKFLTGQVGLSLLDAKKLPQPVHHADPLIGCFHRSNQNALIATRNGKCGRNRCITTETISQQHGLFLGMLQCFHILTAKIITHATASF